MRIWIAATAVALTIGGMKPATADDAYYVLRVDDLTITSGKLPEAPANTRSRWGWTPAQARLNPRAILDGEGEVYCFAINDVGLTPSPSNVRLAVHVAQRRELSGRLFLANSNGTGMVELRFTTPDTDPKSKRIPAVSKREFYARKADYYQTYAVAGIPGTAWFRYQEQLARRAADGEQRSATTPARVGPTPQDLEDTLALFTGGRAVAENLALNRTLTPSKDEPATVSIGTLQGIAIAEIDWKSRLRNADPQLDPLAALVPADQHGVFFPTFAAAIAVADEFERNGTQLSRLVNSRPEDAGTRARYERQLGIGLSGVGRMIGPRLVTSLVVTGSDPYFPIGTDVAVLLATPQPATLKNLLLAQITLGAQASKNARPVSGEFGGVAYSGMRSSDRSVCSYVAELKGAVVVTNSPDQLKRLVEVSQGKSPSLGSLDEYKFFRTRYPRGEADETGLIVLSDATIRRWCSPRWRIAASRRLRERAWLSEQEAANLDRLVAGKSDSSPVSADAPVELLADGVYSPRYGSLAFQTPIIELDIDKVSQLEADAYVNWRSNYERNWRWAFDPIALRFGVNASRLSADLTVMPLIAGSDYRWLIDIAGKTRLEATDGDPHPSLFQAVLAIDKDGSTMKSWGNIFTNIVRLDAMAWVGNWVSVFVDDDPLWDELNAIQDEQELSTFFDSHVNQLPVALEVGVSSGLRLTAFIAGLRAFVEQSSPGMTEWETLKHGDEPYVKVGPSARARGDGRMSIFNPTIYYATSGESLIVTLSEKTMQRALDRRVERAKLREAGKPLPTSNPPWLGESLSVTVSPKLSGVFPHGVVREYQDQMQQQAWAALPILNEWKRRYPNQDPVKLHQRFWQARLESPSGGQYVWNEKWQTMEATDYGHPGEPKPGPDLLPLLKQWGAASFGVSFEDQGLHARAVLDRSGK